jgi:3D (Asp-Asp-Asp) domain-containing protein
VHDQADATTRVRTRSVHFRRGALVALGAAALALGAAASGLPVLHSASGQDRLAANSVLAPRPVAMVDSMAVLGAPDAVSAKPLTGPTKKINIELTGYSWFDNTPAGSSEVSNPIVHKDAGGQGTYSDPITVAVADGSFKPGTRFYIPKVQRYVIVEDSGASDGDNHLDMWVGGKGGSESSVSKCMDRITGSTTAEQNPPAGRPVLAGPIYGPSGCHLPKSAS